MNRAIVIMLLAALGACAGPARDDDRDERRAAREELDRRDQERLCRIYADSGRTDPNCPREPATPGSREPMLPPPPAVPPVPPVPGR